MRDRERRQLADTRRLVLAVKVHAADLRGRAALPPVIEHAPRDFPRLAHLWADQGYTGRGRAWIEAGLRRTVESVRHTPHARGEWQPLGNLSDSSTVRFEWECLPSAPKYSRGILTRRGVAGRASNWLAQRRWLAKEYERRCDTSEAVIHAAMSRSGRADR